MIILDSHRIVMLTPPRCGTHVLHAAYCCLGGQHVIGPSSFDPPVSWHTVVIPPIAAEYRVLGIVRHPLDRLVSLYHHLCHYHAGQGWGAPGFTEFAWQLCRDELPKLYTTSLTQFYAPVPTWLPIHWERLAEDLRIHGLGRALPRLEVSVDRRDWRGYYTAETLARVREHFAADFAYGYSV